MDYTRFPNAQSSNAQPDSGNKVSPKDFYGSGAVGGPTGMSFGGATGVNVSGTQGIWAGDKEFPAAPFSVDLKGNVKANALTANGATFTDVTANGATFQNVTLKDSTGTAFIDPTGLNSLLNFSIDSVSSGVITTNNTGTPVTVPGVTLTFSVDRSSKFILFANVEGSSKGGGDLFISNIFADGSAVSGNGIISGPLTPSVAGVRVTTFMHAVTVLGPGSHTVDVRFYTNGVNDVTSYYGTISYVKLGN